MSKYTSFHFSPLNNRSMLMPRVPKGTKVTPNLKLTPPDESISIDPANPYMQPNTGLFTREADMGPHKRPYAIYVPHDMLSKGPAALIFPDSGGEGGGVLVVRSLDGAGREVSCGAHCT